MAIDVADLARRAAELGGEEAIASVSLRRELVICAGPDGALLPPRRTFDLFVRLLVRDGGGRIGVARCSTSVSPEALLTLSDQAHALAAASQIDLRPLPGVAAGDGHEGFDARTADLDSLRGADTAQAAAASIEAGVGRRRTAGWVAEDVEWAIASSGAGVATDRRTGVRLTAQVTDADGRRTGFAQASASAADAIDPTALGARATPLPLPFDRFGSPLFLTPADPIVLLPAALAPLLEVLARVACTGHAHATGLSPYTGRLGEQVAPALVTLADLPQYARTLARSIDVEGVPAQSVSLVAGGFAEGVIHDAVSADEVGGRSTGHAGELGGAGGPVPRNLVLDAGSATSADALLAPVERSVVVAQIERVVTDGPGSTRFTALGRAAYAVERGTPSRLLGDVLITGDLVDVLGSVEDLTATSELVATIDRLPERTVATCCPAARTRGLSVLLP